MPRLLLGFALFALTGLAGWAATVVPNWGALRSSPVDTPPPDLKPGQWIWGGRDKAPGPMAVIVSLTEQRAYVYRNGLLIGVSTISSGRPGYETPTGVFTVLQKDKNHHSNKYENAPMPYQQRLTWDGVALHAGGLPGYPESHGCVHLPTEFARRLFDATNLGMTVVVAKEGSGPVDVVHPRAISPIDPSGAERPVPPLAEGEAFRWHPERAPEGPLSLVLSVPDGIVVVYRNGVEIGRSRVVVTDPLPGTHAYIVAQGYMEGGSAPQWAGTRLPNWISIGIPGHADEAGKAVDASLVDKVAAPREFLDRVLPLLAPGTVLVATDMPILPETTGGKLEVLDADPPST